MRSPRDDITAQVLVGPPLLARRLFGLHGVDRQPVQWAVVAGETPLPLRLHDIILHPHQLVQSEQLCR